MGQQVELFNLAVGYMKDELFDEATILLEKLVGEKQDFDQARWALGITYTLAGYPAKAVQVWSGRTTRNNSELVQAIDTVEQKLPIYKEIYQNYNQALKYIQECEYNEAGQLFEEILTRAEEVPLPVECYQGYILTKTIIGEEKMVFDEMIKMPAYVRKSLVIQELGEELHQFLEEYRNTKAIFTDKVKRKSNMIVHVKSWFNQILN